MKFIHVVLVLSIVGVLGLGYLWAPPGASSTTPSTTLSPSSIPSIPTTTSTPSAPSPSLPVMRRYRSAAIQDIALPAQEIRDEILHVFPLRYAEADDDDFEIPGGYVRENIKPIVHDVAQLCYEKYGMDAEYGGAIRLYFVLYSDPKIGAIAHDTQVIDENGPVALNALTECLVSTVQDMSFEKYKRPGFSQVVLDFAFSPPT